MTDEPRDGKLAQDETNRDGTTQDVSEHQLVPASEPPLPMTADEIGDAHARWWKERRERGEALVAESGRGWSALQGWAKVESPEDWDRTLDRTAEEWVDGRLFLKMLGAERYVDPEHSALLLHLWHHFLGTYRPQGPAEFMAIAMALFAFHHLIRVNEFAGNLATRSEHALFDTVPPAVRVIEKEGTLGRITPEAKIAGTEAIEQLGRDVLPLMDRLNRMVLRNLKALRDLRAIPLALNVQNFGQMNVGQAQTNVGCLPTEQPKKRRRRTS